MDIYNMAAFPRPGSPEWLWYQQMQVQMKQGQGESPGCTPADFQAFNLRPRGQGQGHPRNMRPRFIPTSQRTRGPPPQYFMMNQHMVRNSTSQGMMNPRMYQPPVHMAGNRPRTSPMEGLQELCKGPQRPSPSISQRISPVNQRVSMETVPRGPSPLSYMEFSEAVSVSHQGPPASSQVRGHVHPTMPHSGMRMPVNNHPMMHPPPLMKADGTLIQPGEQFPGHWTGQLGSVSFQPQLPYNYNGFPAGTRTHSDISAQHGGQVPSLGVTTDNITPQTSCFQDTNFSRKNAEKESSNSQSNGALSNSIFGRWYKPPAEDDEVKYDYIFDVDGDTQNIETADDIEPEKTSNTSSHLIKRPSRLSNEKKSNKGKRLEGEISRIHVFSAFKAQLSPLGSDSLPESHTGFETEPDIFSGRGSNNNISNDQSHSQAAKHNNTSSSSSSSSSSVHKKKLPALQRELNENVTKETNTVQDNNLEKVHDDTLSNVHTSQQQVTGTTVPPMLLNVHTSQQQGTGTTVPPMLLNVHTSQQQVTGTTVPPMLLNVHTSQQQVTDTTVPPMLLNVHTSQQQVTGTTVLTMPPLMQAPMVYNPITLQVGQQLLPPTLTSLTTKQSASMLPNQPVSSHSGTTNMPASVLPNQPNPPVLTHSGTTITPVFVSSDSSTDNSSNPVTCSQDVTINNICILDTFSLSLPSESFVGDIVIQPQEPNVNPNSSKTSSHTNIGKGQENNNQVRSCSRKSGHCDSDSNTVQDKKKVTPLRIRLPFALKSQLQEKLKKNALKSQLQEKLKKNANKTKEMNDKKKDSTKGLFKDTVSPATDTQRSRITDSLEKSSRLVTEKFDESLECPKDNEHGEVGQDSVVSKEENTSTNEGILPSSSADSVVNNVDKLLPSEKDTHKGNSNDRLNDPQNQDRLKEIVCKISSQRKRRKSAVLLDSQPCTPSAKKRRLSKDKEQYSDASCQKTGDFQDRNDLQQNSFISKSQSLDKDNPNEVGELPNQPDSTVIGPNINTITTANSTSNDKLPVQQHCSQSNITMTLKENLGSETEIANSLEPAPDVPKGTLLEKDLTTDNYLSKNVGSLRPKLRKVRVSNRPWLSKGKEMGVADSQSKTEDLHGFLSKSKDKCKDSVIDKSSDEKLKKKKSEIEKCKERTKSLCLKLRRISYPPSSSKDVESGPKIKCSKISKVPGMEMKSGTGTSRASSKEKVVTKQDSVHTENNSEFNLDEFNCNISIGDGNMNNNNNSGLSDCVRSESSTVLQTESLVMEESAESDIHNNDPATVPCDSPTTEVSTATPTKNSGTEDVTAQITPSPVKVNIVKDKSEIQKESEEIQLINFSPKQRDTFDINIVNVLFFYVTFHGSKILCVSCLSGKYFVVRELLNKCFLDIAEKNKKKGVHTAKVFKQVYVAKERDLSIPYVELPQPLRYVISEYLVKERLIRNTTVSHIGIIHVNDAKRLYHFFYGVKTCHDVKCVLPWQPENVIETTNQTDESRQDSIKSKKDAEIDPPVIVVTNEEKESTTTDPVEKDVEIITCQVIYDREVEDKTSEPLGTSKLSETSGVPTISPENTLKVHVPKVSSSSGREPSVKVKRRMMVRNRKRLSSGRRGEKGDLSDDSDATIPYMDETESDVECDKRKLSSSTPDTNLEDTEISQSLTGSSKKNSNVCEVICIDDENDDSPSHEDLANMDSEDKNSDDRQEIRIDPDQNDDYVVRGGIAELYEGMFRFLVINGRKFFPFEDLCQHYEKGDLINCLKSKPGHFKAIRCSMIETNFLNNLEPSLPTLVENATIIEENFLHCSAKLNFRKMFDNPEQEVVDLTTNDDAVVPQRLADSPLLTPEASPTLTNTKVSAFESFNTEDMLVDTSDDVLMMELGTAKCDTNTNGTVHKKVENSEDDLSAIDGREQKAVADAFRDIWEENHSLKSKMAVMTQDFEEMKKDTMDFEATCQQYGDAIELMTKAIQQTCTGDQKKDLS